MKRNEELVSKIESNEELSSNELVKQLLDEYKRSTYENWNDRHEFYQKMVSDMVNDFGFKDDELAEKMANEHPTLQQSFMRLCMKFINKMSARFSSGYYDGRNERSCKLANKIVKTLEGDEYLPII